MLRPVKGRHVIDQLDQLLLSAYIRGVARTVNIYEAKTHLSELVEAAAGGEEIVIAKNGAPKARLAPLAARPRSRKPSGLMKISHIAEDFDLTDETIVKDFEELGLSLLLDTHVFLWFESDSPRLSKRARALIRRTEQIVYVSAASFWEIAIKRRAGKIVYDGSARTAASEAGFLELAIEAADAETAGALNWDHRDPFDRMLVAQCRNRELTLVTADARLRAREDIAVMWAG